MSKVPEVPNGASDKAKTPPPPWRRKTSGVSLPEVHRSIVVPGGASFWRKMMAFAGPGFLVAVGYMDPGNWATDLAGGAQFGYSLLSVIMISNLMSILLQHLCVKLGVLPGGTWRRLVATTIHGKFPSASGFCAR
jgi:manganese transport protein